MRLKTRATGRRRVRALATAATACAALAALPAAGEAATMRLGSDLTKPANVVEAHGPDSAFWNTSIDGVSGAMPADGQITFARVKGTVLKDPSGRVKPDPQFHFQVLRPQPDGRMKVMLSSAPFRVPHGGDPQEISGYKPVNLCVQKGDYVDFNDIGGFEWRWGPWGGMPFQVFSRTSGSQVGFYKANEGTNIGSQWRPLEQKVGLELLMQTTLATGPDATDMCPGGFRQHIFKGLGLGAQDVTISEKKRVAKVSALCPPPTYGRCRGVLTLKSRIKGQDVLLGGSSFVVKPGWSARFELKLTTGHLKLIKKAGGVTATLTAVGKDDPDGDRRAKPGVPIQSKTTAGTVKLKVG